MSAWGNAPYFVWWILPGVIVMACIVLCPCDKYTWQVEIPLYCFMVVKKILRRRGIYVCWVPANILINMRPIFDWYTTNTWPIIILADILTECWSTYRSVVSADTTYSKLDPIYHGRPQWAPIISVLLYIKFFSSYWQFAGSETIEVFFNAASHWSKLLSAFHRVSKTNLFWHWSDACYYTNIP